MNPLMNEETALSDMPPVSAWLSDMDGVLVKENRALPGAQQFLDALKRKEMPFLVLTNNSIFTNRDLSARLKRSGLSVPEERIWTSANATAAFLSQQSPASTAYVIGEAGLTTGRDHCLVRGGLPTSRTQPRDVTSVFELVHGSHPSGNVEWGHESADERRNSTQ